MIRNILLGLLAIIVLTGLLVAFNYYRFTSEYRDQLLAGSEVIETAAGPIEFVRKGTTGPVVLFIHGTPGGYDQSPAEVDFRMIAPSRPGYLRTPITVGRTPQEQADAHAALLDALGINEPVFVMGASGGGPSSYAFAAAYPERTAGLIALEAVSHTMPATEEMPDYMRSDVAMWLLLKMLTLQGPQGVVNMMIPDPANQERVMSDPAKQAQIMNMVWSIWPYSLRSVGAENDFKQFSDLTLPLASIKVPTLAVHGTADINVDYAQSEYAGERISDFTLHTIEGADHMMPVTHSEEMGEAIRAFTVALMTANPSPAGD